MRKSLNDNPVIAVVLIGILGIGVAFFLLTRVGKGGGSSSTTPTTTGASATAAAAPTTPGAAPLAPATGAPAAPATGIPTAPATAPTAPSVGRFVAGPGLPAPVVRAYQRGDAVALLVTKPSGIDDRSVRKGFRLLRAIPGVAAFETSARHVARYARIATGVDLDRVPALVAIRPRGKGHGHTPHASVTYGFNSAQRLVQVVRDALYHGPANLPFHPR